MLFIMISNRPYSRRKPCILPKTVTFASDPIECLSRFHYSQCL